ncbi:hypothetical protein LTR53_016768, partial [Teratosphaeriaceae sp. CCFEE 6253]
DLRRHLALATGELRDPIVIPKGLDEDGDGSMMEEDGGSDSGVDDVFASFAPAPGEEGYFEHEDWQADAHALLADLGLFKRKVADDRTRFPHPAADGVGVDVGA